MVATEVDVAVDAAAAAEDSVTAVASRETSARRKRSPTTTEKAEEVAAIIAVLEAALVNVVVSEAVEVAMAVNSAATLMEIPTGAITTKAGRKDTTTKTVVIVATTCEQTSIALTISLAIDLQMAEITLSEVCEEVAVACAVVAVAATTLAGHRETAWALAVTKFQEMTTIAEDVMKMMMPETCNQ